MPTTITEGYIRFTFDDEWDVEKYDNHPDTRTFIGVVENRQAMDFVGCRSGIAYLIEIKDYRGHRIQNKLKLNGELQRHIAAKSFDTIAGLVLARRQSPSNLVWRKVIERCQNQDGRIRVVLWLEDDALFTGPRGKTGASVFLKELKAALAWMPGHKFVVNRAYEQGALPGVTAADLPGAAGHRP